jgi:C1A family cysteine protease
MGNDILTNAVTTAEYDIRDYTIKAGTEIPDEYKCPVEIPVKNQHTKPTCVAHALASLVEYHSKRQSGKYRKFSTEFIYGYRPEGYYVGNGMCIKDGLKTLLNVGDVYYTELEGNSNFERAMEKVRENVGTLAQKAKPHRISAYYKLNATDEIKTAIMRDGFVVASMNTYKGAKLVKDVYTYEQTAEHGRHCVLLIGWTKDGWLVQNSWGYLYGGDGKFILPFSFKLNEAWGVTDDITDITTPKRSKWLDVIYKLINAVVKLFEGAFACE